MFQVLCRQLCAKPSPCERVSQLWPAWLAHCRLTDVDASRCKELLAYEDQNWFLETGSGVRYVLKIHNSSLTAHVPAFEVRLVRSWRKQHAIWKH